MKRVYCEFFCGGGMARIGLGESWQCGFANDNSEKKAKAYKQNFAPADELVIGNIEEISVKLLPDEARMAWASFPCQDLSLAGNGKGLNGHRSGTFHSFIDLIAERRKISKPIPILAIENVVGTVSSNKGKDFVSILSSLADNEYIYGPLILDARHFVPQSRPRLIIIALHETFREEASNLIAPVPVPFCASKLLVQSCATLPDYLSSRLIWWNLPAPRESKPSLAELIEDEPESVCWDSDETTSQILALMSDVNRAKVDQALASGSRQIGTLYRRTRRDSDGKKVQRAEVRFDNISGCLRTPGGGSSRQRILVVEDQTIRSRLLSAREAARLMGLPDSYKLPNNYNEAYHLAGDGVVVPVVRWLNSHLLEPLARITESYDSRLGVHQKIA
jgi:DNA (cytosine-5)-methyltransferase 1